MQLSPLALAVSAGIVWGGGILLVGLVALAAPGYGQQLLDLAASLYPGYHNSGTFGDVVVGTLYGVADGFVGGYIFAWLYNRLPGVGVARPEAGAPQVGTEGGQ